MSVLQKSERIANGWKVGPELRARH
jgi:hypothetical protein